MLQTTAGIAKDLNLGLGERTTMAILREKPAEWRNYRRQLPPGFRVITDREALADSNILSQAREFINRQVKNNAPIGASEQRDIGGRSMLFIVEPHYHDPGGKTRPHGWHKGCTVFIGPSLAASVPLPPKVSANEFAQSLTGKYNIKG